MNQTSFDFELLLKNGRGRTRSLTIDIAKRVKGAVKLRIFGVLDNESLLGYIDLRTGTVYIATMIETIIGHISETGRMRLRRPGGAYTALPTTPADTRFFRYINTARREAVSETCWSNTPVSKLLHQAEVAQYDFSGYTTIQLLKASGSDATWKKMAASIGLKHGHSARLRRVVSRARRKTPVFHPFAPIGCSKI